MVELQTLNLEDKSSSLLGCTSFTKEGNYMNLLNGFTKEQIIEILNKSKSYAEALSLLGMSKNQGANRIILDQYIKEHNIDVSHFIKKETRNEQNIFIENSSVTQKVLREWYKKGNYSEYKCAICGQEPIWQGKPLTLTLDHINGKNNDNSLNNLRWICPNCDRQLPTFGSKNKDSKKYYCQKCGKKLSKKRKTGLCRTCFNLNIKKENKKTQNNKEKAIKEKQEKGITREFLKQEIRSKPFTTIAKEQGVSDNAIRKWCKLYNLPSKSSEIKKYSDEEWKNI